jgi:hypothetical protein
VIKTAALSGKNTLTTQSLTDPTPEELQYFSTVTGSQDAGGDPFVPYNGYSIVKNVTWDVLTGYNNYYKVKSAENVEITYTSGVGLGTNHTRYISNFNHAGSYYEQSGSLPINLGSWDEKLNEHYPMSFGSDINWVSSHVKGVISISGFSRDAENFWYVTCY